MNQDPKNQLLLIGVYISILMILLLIVSAVPLLISKGLALSHQMIIEEEFLETSLIVALFTLSFLIWKSFNRRMKFYRQAVRWSDIERSKLVSRLLDAFQYIGVVNVEISETMTVLCGQNDYPLTKKDLKAQFHLRADRIMRMLNTPWTIIRMIQRSNCRTIKEYGFERASGVLPAAVIGNRAILEGTCAKGMKIVSSCQRNLDLQTVIILPVDQLRQEEQLLITAMANQIEMLFLLFQNGCLHESRLKDIIDLE